MSLQPLIAAGSDTFAMRTVRFASGNFVPVIGSMLGEAAKTVYASVGLIKSVSGSAAIVTVLAITVPPAITIVFCKFAVLLSGVLARLLGAENQAKLLYDINSLLGIMLGLVLGAGAVFIIATGVFIRINAGLSA